MKHTTTASSSHAPKRRRSSRSATGLLAVTLLMAAGLLTTLWTLPDRAERLDVGRTTNVPRPETTPLPTAIGGYRTPRGRPLEVAQAGGVYGAPIGSQFSYRLSANMSYRMTPGASLTDSSSEPVDAQVQLQLAPGDRSMQTRVRVRADQTTTVVARTDDAIEVVVQCANVRLTHPGTTPGDTSTEERAQVDAQAKACEHPVAVRMGRDGAILGYRFHADLTGDQRNFVRALLSAFEFVVPVDQDLERPTRWTAAGADATGRYQARYDSKLDPDTLLVTRTKLGYDELGPDPEPAPHRLESARARARFSRSLPWFTDADVAEQLHVDLPWFDARIDHALTAKLTLTATGIAPNVPELLAAFPAAQPWAPASGRTEEVGALAEADERAQWRARLAGQTVASLTAALTELLNANPVDREAVLAKWNELSWLIRLDDNAVDGVLAEVRRDGGRTEVADVLLSALGSAETPAAQSALVAVRGNSALPTALRESAAIAMFQLGQPSTELMDAVYEQAQRIASGQTGAEQDHPGADLLLLGALAPRHDEQLAMGRNPMQALLGLERAAQRSGRAAAWLDALGNAGHDARITQAASRYVADSDPVTRAAAFGALRDVHSKPARTLLIESGLRDADVAVRIESVRALARHQHRDATAALRSVVKTDRDPRARRQALGVLAERGQRGALEAAARRDPDPDTRRWATELLRRERSQR